jgi:hypothetical protein
MKFQPLARLLRLALICALAALPNFVSATQTPAAGRTRPALRTIRQTPPQASALPDVNGIRGLQPAEPAPVPSTACSPLNPGCQSGGALLRSPFLDHGASYVGTTRLESFVATASLTNTNTLRTLGASVSRASQPVRRGVMAASNLWLEGVAGYPVSMPVVTNQPPAVNFTLPVQGAVYAAGSSVTLSADASDSDGTIAKVEFLANGSKFAEVTSAPFTLVFNNAPAGTYVVTARAIDNLGIASTSAPVNISVVPPGTNTQSVSLSLDGATGRVSVPNSASLNITGALTVEAWFKSVDNSTNMAIAGNLSGAGGFVLLANAGMPQLYYLNGAGQADFAIAWPPNITPGEWHHMAGVFDGSQIRVYLDGQLVASKNTTIAPGASTTAFSIGANPDGTWPLRGNVDEVRVSAGALYAANFTPQQQLTASSSTRGLWKFDGQVALDSSGNSNNGSLVGGASYSTDVPGAQRINFALASSGAAASASYYDPDGTFGAGLQTRPADAIDGVRYCNQPSTGTGYWRGGSTLPQYLDVTFSGSKTINEVDVYTVRDAYTSTAEPTASETFTQYGVTSFDVQYWTGTAWASVPGGSVSGNNLVWKKITFAPVETTKIRVIANTAVDGVVRIAELEAYGYAVAPNMESSLVAHWKFDEAVSTTAGDATGNANTATLTGPLWVAGRTGTSALNFDGVDDYLGVAVLATPKPRRGMTAPRVSATPLTRAITPTPTPARESRSGPTA